MKREDAIMNAVARLIEDGDESKLYNSKLVSMSFEIIGFPEDAAKFLGEWYPEYIYYAYDRWECGTYDLATVGVFGTVEEAIEGYDQPREVLDNYGLIIEDASFNGVIALISY